MDYQDACRKFEVDDRGKGVSLDRTLQLRVPHSFRFTTTSKFSPTAAMSLNVLPVSSKCTCERTTSIALRWMLMESRNPSGLNRGTPDKDA